MTIRLVDVSAAQGDIPLEVWRALLANGVVGAIVKVTEGTWTDPRARANIERARAVGMTVGVYAFARMSLGEPRAQVAALWTAMGDTMPGLPPVLDFESAPLDWTHERVVAWAEEWCIAARDMFGRWPLLYSYPYFLSALGPALTSSRVLGQCPLWIAGGRSYLNGDGHVPDLAVEHPPVVALWGANWTLWQHDGNGGRRLPNGVDADFNVFNGDERAFRELRGLPDEPPPDTMPAIVHPPIDFIPPEPPEQ